MSAYEKIFGQNDGKMTQDVIRYFTKKTSSL